MPYKRPDSDVYQIHKRNLPGYGPLGPISTRTRDRKIAQRMEAMLETIASRALLEPRWRGLLDAVAARTISLPEIMQAAATRRLEALLLRLSDPLLAEAIDRYEREAEPTRATRIGFSELRRLAPKAARLSLLADAKEIERICRAREAEGVQRNSVHRTLLRAISLLLTREIGRAERTRIFAELDYPAVDDTREVYLSPDELSRLLAACRSQSHPEVPVIVETALLTSADRGVLLAGQTSDGYRRGLLVRDLSIYQEPDGSYSGEVYLLDKKARGRTRTAPLGDRLARELLLLARGKGPDETVFSLEYRHFDYHWKQARREAGLMHVRFKDLRAQFAIFADKAGVPLSTIAPAMGHKQETMTSRYLRHQAALSGEQLRAIESAMFGKVG